MLQYDYSILDRGVAVMKYKIRKTLTAAAVCGIVAISAGATGCGILETNQTAATTDADSVITGVPTSTPKPSSAASQQTISGTTSSIPAATVIPAEIPAQVITMTPTPTAEITEEPTKTPEPTQEPEDSSADTVESAAESTANSKASDEANSTSSSAAANGTASSPYAGEGNTATNNQEVNIHSTPAPGGDNVIGSLPEGTSVTVIANVNGWLEFSYNGTIGYADSEYFG